VALDADTRNALATMDEIVASLRADPDPDDAVRALLEAIEDDRAYLLAATISGAAVRKPPSRFRRPVTPAKRP
jgi:hypothetical protein